MNKQQKVSSEHGEIYTWPVIPRYYSLFLSFHVITVDFNTPVLLVKTEYSFFFLLIHAVAMKIAAALGV